MKIDLHFSSQANAESVNRIVAWKNRTVEYLKGATLPKAVVAGLLLGGGVFLAESLFDSSLTLQVSENL